VALEHDETLLLKPDQGFADRASANFHPNGQLVLAKPIAALDLTRNDGPAQVVRDLIGQDAPTSRPNSRQGLAR